MNDVYRRFLRRDRSERHYVAASRVAVVLLAAVAAGVAWQMDSIQRGWIYIIELTAGVALVWLLRWYWWRVNAWAEISAMAGSVLLANGRVVLAVIEPVLPASVMRAADGFYAPERARPARGRRRRGSRPCRRERPAPRQHGAAPRGNPRAAEDPDQHLIGCWSTRSRAAAAGPCSRRCCWTRPRTRTGPRFTPSTRCSASSRTSCPTWSGSGAATYARSDLLANAASSWISGRDSPRPHRPRSFGCMAELVARSQGNPPRCGRSRVSRRSGQQAWPCVRRRSSTDSARARAIPTSLRHVRRHLPPMRSHLSASGIRWSSPSGCHRWIGRSSCAASSCARGSSLERGL